MVDPVSYRRRRILTKTVYPEWYRRYAKILNYEDRIFYQPLREIRAEKKMLKELEEPENPNDLGAQLSRQLMEARKKKIKMVLMILEGNFGKLDLSALKEQNTNPLSALTHKESVKVQTLFWRQRAIRPPGYVLSKKSKWRLFWDNPKFMKGLRKLVAEYKSAKIRARWMKAFRLFQSIYRFNQVLAMMSGATDDIFKNFRSDLAAEQGFQKKNFRASAVGKNLDPVTLFTLSKQNRTAMETLHAVGSLKVMRSFAEFPRYLQKKICEVAWYLELEPDKMIIREGQVADSFYFLLAGRVATVKMDYSLQSNFQLLETHTMGALIGSEGFDGVSFRHYSAYTMERCKVIAVNFDDFHKKCLNLSPGGANAPHISFLSQLAFMKYFPVMELVDNAEGNIFLFYFITDSIVTRDVANSPYIFVVYKGSCRVLAEVVPKRRQTTLVHVPPFQLTRPSNDDGVRENSSLPVVVTKQNSVDHGTTEKTIDRFSKACGRRTIAESIKTRKEETVSVNLNLIEAASMERFQAGRKPRPFVRDKAVKDWIQFKVLREGDVIGLEGIDLGDEQPSQKTIFNVVSGGAEVIMILKSFFLKNASSKLFMDLRASSYIHPDESQLRVELDRRLAWKRFQNGVRIEAMKQKKGFIMPALPGKSGRASTPKAPMRFGK